MIGIFFFKQLTLPTQDFWSVKREGSEEYIQLHIRSL